MRRGAPFAAAFLALAAAGNAAAAPPAAVPDVVRWPVPWAAGQTFVYASETLDRDSGNAGEQAMRTSDVTTVEIRDGGDRGLVQAWRYSDFDVELLAGEPGPETEAIRAAADALEDLPILVQLDADAAYAGILNLQEVATRFRTALRPVMLAMLEAAIAKDVDPGADPAVAEAARAEMVSRLDGMLAKLASPPMVEAMLKRQMDTFNAFTGVDLEPGQAYEAEVELDNPVGETPLPARVEFAVFLPEAHPGHGLLEWTSTIDPERGMQAVREIVEGLTGEALPEEAGDELPEGIVLEDEGFFLFDLETGVPEMFEMERTVALGDRRKYDRSRMRLVSGDHEHEWVADPAGEVDAPVPAAAVDGTEPPETP